jgi:hypothetical protein
VNFILIEPTVENHQLPEIEQRGRSIYSKHQSLLLAQQQERTRSSSTQTIDSQSHDSITSSKHPLSPGQQIIKSEDKHQPIPLNESEIQRFQLLKDKFERRQPIDTVFGMKDSNLREIIFDT